MRVSMHLGQSALNFLFAGMIAFSAVCSGNPVASVLLAMIIFIVEVVNISDIIVAPDEWFTGRHIMRVVVTFAFGALVARTALSSQQPGILLFAAFGMMLVAIINLIDALTGTYEYYESIS